MVDPARVPRGGCVQVLLCEPSTKPALDAAEAQEQVDVPKEWKQKGLLGGAGDGNGAWPDDGRPELVVNAWPARRLPAAVVACVIVPGHDCRPTDDAAVRVCDRHLGSISKTSSPSGPSAGTQRGLPFGARRRHSGMGPGS